MVLWLDIGTNSVVTHKTKEYFIIPNGFFCIYLENTYFQFDMSNFSLSLTFRMLFDSIKLNFSEFQSSLESFQQQSLHH